MGFAICDFILQKFFLTGAMMPEEDIHLAVEEIKNDNK